jgi:hypothetical protein
LETSPQKSYELELHRLEVLLRELKVKYDQFFAGGLDREPLELRGEAEQIIGRINKQPPGQYAVRFHFNALVSRYNSFTELWNKSRRAMEEGGHRAPSFAERCGVKERLLTRCSIGDAERDRGELQRLHARFSDARARYGKGPISFDKFARGIAAQARALRAKHDCERVEVRLVEDGDNVEIRARPGHPGRSSS